MTSKKSKASFDEQNSDVDGNDDTDYSDRDSDESHSSLDAQNNDDLLSSDDETEKLYLSKDDSMVRTSKFPSTGRRPSANIMNEKPGVKGLAKTANTVMKCWNLFFPSEVIEKIVEHTNQKLTVIRNSYKRKNGCLATNAIEIKAFFGILYLSGFLNQSHVEIRDLWNTNGLAPEYYRMVMRENRFRLLLRALRFDDSETRVERKKTDKIAAIRDTWDGFNKKCLELYTPGPNVTIDEMIAAFRGKCSFKQYIPSKPDRYGLKIFGMVDSQSFYTSNMEIYVGKQPSEKNSVSNKPCDIVKRVCSSVLNTGRNITMDNWFSSITLAVDLLENFKTTIVATLRNNKPQIPSHFLDVSKREPCSSMFGFFRNITMVSYISKNKKKTSTILISSMHRSCNIDPVSKDKKKPEIITYYNKTKAAVDVVDQMRAKYNVARTSRRWPLTLFFVIMNIAVINAVIIYNLNSLNEMKRKDFIKVLCLELTKPHILERSKNPHIPFNLRQTIGKYVDLPEKSKGKNKDEPCAYCPTHKNRKTKSQCSLCSKFICGKEHTVKISFNCNVEIITAEKDYEDY